MDSGKFFLYRNKPLVRKGNILYYGYMSEVVVAMLVIKNSHKFKDVDIGDSVGVQLILTNPLASVEDMVIKSSTKIGLFEALDVAGIWIDRYIKKLS